MATTPSATPFPSAPSSSPPAPLQQITLTADDLKDPALINNILQNHAQLLNYILGHGGEPPYFKAGANFGGKPVRNVGMPETDGDVVPLAFANSNFGAAAIAPQIQALGKSVLQSYRRINDRVQQERYSTFLNSITGVAPTSNTSAVIPGTPSGGFVPVTITAGFHQFVDGHQEPYAAFNDSLTLPTSYAIASMTRTGGVVTGTTTGINVLGPGETVVISGASDPSFDGQQLLVAPTSTPTFTFNQSGPNATATGGVVSLNGVYYYSRRVGQSVLFRTGPFASDSWTNRLSFAGGTNPSLDGSTLIAVVVVNNNGVDTVNSGAGNTPPVSNIGAGVRLFGRL
jgi:hypothetical protein